MLENLVHESAQSSVHAATLRSCRSNYLTQPQYTDTWQTSPSAGPVTPGAWQGSHCSANFKSLHYSTWKNLGVNGNQTLGLLLSRQTTLQLGKQGGQGPTREGTSTCIGKLKTNKQNTASSKIGISIFTQVISSKLERGNNTAVIKTEIKARSENNTLTPAETRRKTTFFYQIQKWNSTGTKRCKWCLHELKLK